MGVFFEPKESDKEKEIKYLLDVYDRIWQLHQMNNDNYFKRTQVLMFALQIGLATAFVKILTTDEFSKCWHGPALLIISLLGIIFAFIWISSIDRQWGNFEFERCYLRYIEGHLMQLGVPLAIYRIQSAVYHHKRAIFFGNEVEERIYRRNEGKLNNNDLLFQKEFPYGKRVKMKFANLEKLVVHIIIFLWTICISTIAFKAISEFLSYYCYMIFIIPISYLGYLIIEWMIKKIKDKNILFHIDQEFQTELNKGEISDKLRKKYKDKKIELSRYAKISVEKQCNTWLINDRQKVYVIKKEGDKLNVYRQPILFWDLRNDFI